MPLISLRRPTLTQPDLRSPARASHLAQVPNLDEALESAHVRNFDEDREVRLHGVGLCCDTPCCPKPRCHPPHSLLSALPHLSCERPWAMEEPALCKRP